MKERGYRIHLVGYRDTVKRMVASLYLVNSKQREQILKVCICDDLPHVINQVETQQKASKSHELLEGGLHIQVSHGRSLTVAVNILDEADNLCMISPQKEVIIPEHAVWEPNAALAVDFYLTLNRPQEDAALQIAITSHDEHGSEIPLSVPPRVRVTWQPSDVIGVQRIRKAWEMNEEKMNSLPRQLKPGGVANKKSNSLPRFQQPVYQGIEDVLRDRTSPRVRGKIIPVQDNNWNNIVTSPIPNNNHGINHRNNVDYHKDIDYDRNIAVHHDSNDAENGDLPTWAKGLGDQFDYDDVVVV